MVARVVAEQPADQRQVPQHGHLALALVGLVLDQPADHDEAAVLDDHVGLEAALVQHRVVGRSARDHRGIFYIDGQPHRAAFGDLGLDRQLQADVVPLERLERIDRARVGRTRGRVGTGQQADVLPDQELALLIVQRLDVGARQDVGVAQRLERPRQQADVGDRGAADVDLALDDAEVQSWGRRQDAPGQPNDIRTGSRTV